MNIAKSNLLLVPFTNTYKLLKASDVIHITSSKGSSVIKYSDGTEYVSSKSLKEALAILPSDMFIALSRSAIVNIDEITSVVTEPSVVIQTRDGEEFSLSRRRQKEFFERIRRL